MISTNSSRERKLGLECFTVRGSGVIVSQTLKNGFFDMKSHYLHPPWRNSPHRHLSTSITYVALTALDVSRSKIIAAWWMCAETAHENSNCFSHSVNFSTLNLSRFYCRKHPARFQQQDSSSFTKITKLSFNVTEILSVFYKTILYYLLLHG